MSYLLLLYYISISVGIILLCKSTLIRIPIFSNQPRWALILLGLGFFPIIISWLSYTDIFRIPYLVAVLGALSALFAWICAWSNYKTLLRWIRRYVLSSQHLPVALLFISLIGASIIGRYCYMDGGSNNWVADDLRGLSFISSFAANYLKPAYPLDFSQPLSYSYYLYEYLAFLYSAVNGFHYPSILLLLGSILAVICFYFSLAFFCKEFICRTFPSTLLATLLAINFFGFDFVFGQGMPFIDGWNWVQITQLVSLISFVFHYLLAAAFSLSGWVYLKRGLEQRNIAHLLLAVAFLLLGLTYATITGFFLICVSLLASILYALLRPKRVLGWLLSEWRIWVGALALLMFCLLPEIFTFWGRQEYLKFQAVPVLPFNRISLPNADFVAIKKDIITLFYELGPLFAFSLLTLPIIIFSFWKTRPFVVVSILSLMITSVISSMFVFAQTIDWYWRSANFGFLLLGAISAVCWISYVWQYCRTRIFLKFFFYMALICMLAPGMMNFILLQQDSFNKCTLPPSMTLKMNKDIPLHLPILNGNVDFYRAGRAIISPEGNIDKGHMFNVYKLPENFLKEYEMNAGENICHSTWFGKRLPQGLMINPVPNEPWHLWKRTSCNGYERNN